MPCHYADVYAIIRRHATAPLMTLRAAAMILRCHCRRCLSLMLRYATIAGYFPRFRSPPAAYFARLS